MILSDVAFLARIDGKHFCGLCGSSLHENVKKCSVCQSELDGIIDCIFCEQCGAITPSTVEMCEVCGKKMGRPEVPKVHVTKPPPIPTKLHPEIARLEAKIESLDDEPKPQETPISSSQKETPPPEAPVPSKPSFDLREALIKTKKATSTPSVHADRPTLAVGGPISEKETNPAILHAKIKDLQEEIEILRMSLDEPDKKDTTTASPHQPPSEEPKEAKIDQAAVEKLIRLNRTLATVLEKMKKHEGSSIYKILVNLQEETKEILKLLKIE